MRFVDAIKTGTSFRDITETRDGGYFLKQLIKYALKINETTEKHQKNAKLKWIVYTNYRIDVLVCYMKR